MNLTNLQSTLEETFAGNFVSYYRAHVAHVNIKGRNFYQDHLLLQNIYEYFQDNIDTIAEKLRTVKATMPASLGIVCAISPISDTSTGGDSVDLLTEVHESIEAMIEQYHELNDAAEDVDYIDIANFAQDQIGILAKFRWMLEATLEENE